MNEWVFASEADADAAVAQVNSNAGISSPETWDIPRNIGTIWVVYVPTNAAWALGVANIVRTQAANTATIKYLIESYETTMDDLTIEISSVLTDTDGITDLIDYIEEGP